MTTRDHVRNQLEAKNWAIVRKRARCWGETPWGVDYRHLLDVLDGKQVLTEERASQIRLNSCYHKTTAGDSVGDDIQALLEAITARKQ